MHEPKQINLVDGDKKRVDKNRKLWVTIYCLKNFIYLPFYFLSDLSQQQQAPEEKVNCKDYVSN